MSIRRGIAPAWKRSVSSRCAAIPVAPYVNYEWFYDTRYDAWARTLATLGAEVKLSEHFRLEMYVASQEDEHPQEDSLGALGLVAKWYY